MVEAIRNAIKAYKDTRHEEKLRRRLLSAPLDYLYLKKLLTSLNEQPHKLMIVIKMPSGAVIELKREPPKQERRTDPYMETIE
jgi:hypothetical protein